MDALRVRPRVGLAPVLEWVVAVGFLAATVAVGSLIIDELRPSSFAQTARPAARPLVASVPSSVPDRAVSVPVLPENVMLSNRVKWFR